MSSGDFELNEVLLEDTEDYGYSPPESDFYESEDVMEMEDLEDETTDDLNGPENFEDCDDYYSTEYENDWDSDVGSDLILSPQQEEEIVYELMSIESEAELEEFFGKLFKRIAKKVKRNVIPAAKKLLRGGGGKLLARALPIVGSAMGTAIAPGIGTAIGGAAGGALSSMIGRAGGASAGIKAGRTALRRIAAAPGMPPGMSQLAGALGGGANPLAALLGSGLGGNLLGKLLGGEMEYAGLEDAKKNMAKRVVRTINQAAGHIANNPRSVSEPTRIAKIALAKAVNRHIPKAIRPALISFSNSPITGGSNGRWYRNGNQIVLQGI